MAWIESHDTLGAHPKTRKLARALGISRVQAVGHLQFFWWWAMSYAEDGILTKFDALDIATGAEWEGDEETFVAALQSAGFIERYTNGETVIHDWQDYGGKLVRRKVANAERMRNARAEHVQNSNETRVKPEKRRVQKSTEQENDRSSSDAAPAKKGRPISARIPLPDDWTPPLDEVAASQEFNLSVKTVRLETEQFRDHHRKVGNLFADWNAAWRGWMRRVPEFTPTRPVSLNGRKGGAGTDEFWERSRQLKEQGL